MHMMLIKNGELIPVEVNNENLEAMMTGEFGEEKQTELNAVGIDDFLEFLESLMEFLESLLEAAEEQEDPSVELSDVEDFILKLSEMGYDETEYSPQNSYEPTESEHKGVVVVDTLGIQKRSLQDFLRRMGMRLVYTDSGAYGEYTEETKRAVPFTRAMSVLSFDNCVQFYNNRNAYCARPINPKKLYLTIRDKEVVANKHLLSFHRPDEGWEEIESLIW